MGITITANPKELFLLTEYLISGMLGVIVKSLFHRKGCSMTDENLLTPNEELRLHILGGFWIDLAGLRIDAGSLRLRKARHLFKMLALAPNHRLHREQVMDMLWFELGSRRCS